MEKGHSHSHLSESAHALLQRNLPALSKSMTFASMLRANRNALGRLADLKWLFPPVCERKDQAAMTACERDRYVCAYRMIEADGTLGQLVDIHAEHHMQHTNARLLPWHRVFLHLFEEALHNYHPDVCVPYWDWTQDSEHHVPDWLAGFLPTVHTPTRTIQVVRSPGSEAQLASIVSGTAGALSMTTYDQFSAPINGIHGGVHIWCGGTMSDASVSPADPVFWLHHANLDRLWWRWYNDAAHGNHQNPNLVGADALMDPWSYTETDTRSITALGYAYV
ncbi:MAG TPA: tyrosinase family protein [Kofleriaceae bacterium]|nr:tyrosinase family protein [Kofleriaceae bacterium]